MCSWSSGKHKGKKANKEKEPGDSSDADSQARVAAIIQLFCIISPVKLKMNKFEPALQFNHKSLDIVIGH